MPSLLSASKKPFSSSDSVRITYAMARMSYAPRDRLFDDLSEVDFCLIEILRAVIQILRVYKNADTLAFMLDDSHI